jgi:rod shape-determining protein MreB
VTLRGRPRLAGRGLAIDLGSARTRMLVPGVGLLLDEPSLVAYDRSGRAVAAGRDAWISSAKGPARLSMPVRAGIVKDPVGCVRMLRLLLLKAGPSVVDPREVLVSLPATAGTRDESVAAAVIASATEAHVVLLPSGLAASIGAGLDISRSEPLIVCDIGAGVTELAVIADGRVLASAGVRRGVRDFETDPKRLESHVRSLLHRVLDALPDRTSGDAAAGPLFLVGGGAALPEASFALSSGCQMPLQVMDDPRDVVVKGLADCVVDGVRAA